MIPSWTTTTQASKSTVRSTYRRQLAMVLSIGLLCLGTTQGATQSARADAISDWPMFHHDPDHVGVVPSSIDVSTGFAYAVAPAS